MDPNANTQTDIQDQNLVDDQVTAAVDNLGSDLPATNPAPTGADEDSVESLGLDPIPAETPSASELPGQSAGAASVPPPAIGASRPIQDSGPTGPAAAPVKEPAIPASNPVLGADPAATPAASADTGDLAELKNKALMQLAPLIDKVDMPVEEKYSVVMKAVNSSGDNSMLPKAFDLAQGMTDEQAKAEALLEIINKID